MLENSHTKYLTEKLAQSRQLTITESLLCVWQYSKCFSLHMHSTNVSMVLFLCYVLCICSVAQSCPVLCDPMNCNPPGSSVHGTSQARIQEWVAISSPRGSSQSRIKPAAPALAGGFFTTEWPGVNQKLLLWKLSWAMEKILFTKARPVISMGINSCCIWVVRDYCFPGLWWDPDAHEKVWNEVSERRLRS